MFHVGHNILESVLKAVGNFQTAALFLFVFLLFVESVCNASGIALCEILA